jgi:hypothetical protein
VIRTGGDALLLPSPHLLNLNRPPTNEYIGMDLMILKQKANTPGIGSSTLVLSYLLKVIINTVENVDQGQGEFYSVTKHAIALAFYSFVYSFVRYINKEGPPPPPPPPFACVFSFYRLIAFVCGLLRT